MTRAGHSTLKTILKTVLLTSLVLTVPIVVIRWWGGFERDELNAYDRFLRQRPAEKPDDRIVVVTISDRDIEQLQQYPIHDGTLADVLEKLERYQPRAIGLDISRDVPQGPLAGRKRLTQVIAKSETIISGCLLSRENYPGSPPAPGSGDRVGFADFPQDLDKTVRRSILVSTPTASKPAPLTQNVCNTAREDNEVLSLSLQLALMYLEGNNIQADSNNQGEIQLEKTVLTRLGERFGGYAHTGAGDYQMMLNYRGAKQAVPAVSITDVLQGKVKADDIRDRIVLIGNTSLVSKDTLSTPYLETEDGSRDMHGVLVHAQAVSQILSAVLDHRQLIHTWPEAGEILWIWVWSLGSGWLAYYNRRLGLFLISTLATGVALTGICYGLFLSQGLWIPWVPTLIAAISTALGIRLVDLGNRSGYAQALYEQLLEQWRGGSERDRKGDYLERLVLRARAARQEEAASELIASGGQPKETQSPQMKALYEQISAQIRQDFTTQQAESTTTTKAVNGRSRNQASHIYTLLNRAQQSRSQPLNRPSDSSTFPPTEPPA